MAFTIKGGKFSTTDDDKTIRQPRVVENPVNEVIDILDQIGQDDFTAQAMSRPQIKTNPQALENIRNVTNQFSAASPKVNVQQIRPIPVGSVDDILFNFKLMEAAGQPINYGGGEDQLSGSFTNYPGGEGYRDLVQGGQGLASIGVDDFTDFAMRTRPFVPIAQPPAPPEGTPNVGQGFDPKNTGVSSTVKGLAELLGYDMDSREGLAEYFRDTALADKAYSDQQEMRNKDRDRALAAAALAAQQQQPVDPCPEGYRMDPVSKVCVPVDDTTEPVEITKRTYETMTEPVADYTAKTDFTVPTVTLPDILTYG